MSEDDLLNSRFLERTYQEAMALTQAVASYLEADNDRISGFNLSVKSDVYYASESMRVSTCLMQVMAWFLVQKGVASGEITKEQAGSMKYRLGAEDICLAHVDTSQGSLPAEFVVFLEKAQNIYRQVSRMDKMVYGDRKIVNPVHQLFHRLSREDS
ncbi:MAG: hypothetical protein COA81_08855 [Alphaproteobacteria bacterium]|nr:MAG: hypothetical protein COA81_08855 [Alphaproteobacteria bacterium]